MSGQKRERILGYYEFENGSYIRIVALDPLDTASALKWAERLIASKLQELAEAHNPTPNTGETK